MALFSDLMAAIPVYTGLSPVTFFTIGALVVALYYLVTSLFAPPPPPKRDFGPVEPPPPPPVQLGDVTEEELSAYDGSDPSKPLLMAIKGQIYDVSRSRMFYGPGGPYALFAGKDASRALAKMSFEEQDLNGNLEGLGAYEMDALQDWEWKFIGKYEKVGQIVKKVSELREVPVVSKDEEANSRDIDTTVTEAKDIDTTAAREAEDSVKVDKESEKQVTSEDAKESKEGNEEKVSEEPEKTIAKEETATTE